MTPFTLITTFTNAPSLVKVVSNVNTSNHRKETLMANAETVNTEKLMKLHESAAGAMQIALEKLSEAAQQRLHGILEAGGELVTIIEHATASVIFLCRSINDEEVELGRIELDLGLLEKYSAQKH